MTGPAAPADTLAAWIDARRLAVDAALERWLPATPGAPAVITEPIRYSVRAGGKRLRPVLTLAAAEAVAAAAAPPLTPAEADDLAMPAACALELIHTYSLVHDDLPSMDNDMLRRGKPTLHVVHGEGIAILAGDGLQAEAFGLVAREPRSHDPSIAVRKLRVVARLAEAAGCAGMVGGQAIDLHLSNQAGPNAPPLPDGTLAVLADLHARKTGAMLRAAAAIGAIMAGGDDEVVAALDAFGGELGLAFQIIDDVLDVEGDAAALGKTAGKDAANGKLTYPALVGLDASRRMAHDAVDRAAVALAAAAVPPDRLLGIARWVVTRTS